jgi:uncharacterized phiE125 gp8 family phage protein
MWLPPVTISAPTSCAVTLEAAKEFVRISADDTSFDVELQSLLDGAIAEVERVTSTRLIAQSVLVSASEFTDLEALPIGPVISVTSLKYIDEAGTEVTLAAEQWRLSGAMLQWRIDPQIDREWPATASVSDAVRLTLQVGYGAAVADVPAHIRTTILRATRAQFDGKSFDLEERLVNDRIWL